VDNWRRSFLNKLHEAQDKRAGQFEDALDQIVVPVFEDLSGFLRDNEFKVSIPLNEPRRRSFKYELAENAYVLIIFRFSGVDQLELCTETFVPGSEPTLDKSVVRVSDLDSGWAQSLFHNALDRFVERLAGEKAPDPSEELATV
jgi:hypothetical protein